MGGFPSRNVASVGHDGGAYTTVMYFTCEADAREGERSELPAKLQANTEEMNKLSIGPAGVLGTFKCRPNVSDGRS